MHNNLVISPLYSWCTEERGEPNALTALRKGPRPLHGPREEPLQSPREGPAGPGAPPRPKGVPTRAEGRAHQGPGREGYDITFKHRGKGKWYYTRGGIPRLSDPYITLRAGGGWRSRLWQNAITLCHETTLWRDAMKLCYDTMLWHYAMKLCYDNMKKGFMSPGTRAPCIYIYM